MSDLFCAVTIVVARHAEAAFVEDVFSDEGGSLTAAGREQAAELGRSLRGTRIAAVFSSDLARAVQTAEVAAAGLDVPVTARKSLREVFVGDLTGEPFDQARIDAVSTKWHEGDLAARFDGGESGEEVVARHRAELEAIADQFRGENVLVVGHETALAITVRTLVGAGTDWEPSWENTATVEVSGDADGWSLGART